VEQPSHSEPRARQRSGDVAVAETAIGLYLGLECQLYRVKVVEQSKVEILA